MLNPIDRRVARGELLRWLGWMAIANTLALSLVALRYLDVGDLSTGLVARSFGIAMFFAHFLSIALLPLLPVMLLALVWPLRHVVVPLVWLVNVALSVLLLVDTLVFQQYRFHLNGALVSLFFSGASEETFEFSTMMKAQAVGVALLVAVAHWGLCRIVWRFVDRSGHRRFGYGMATACVALLLATNLFHAYADAMGHGEVTRQTRLLPGYEPLTAKSFLEERGFDVADTAWGGSKAIDGSVDYPRVPLASQEPGEKKNIVFIVIDSWRFDAMNEQVTPNIARFAQNNQRFMQHYSGGNATRMGMFTLFYGIPGTYWHSMLQTNTRPVLVSRLLDLGYEFGIFRSAPLSSPEFHRTIFSGMSHLRMESEGHDSPSRDIDANHDFLDYLQERDPESDDPFFGMVFYDSPHAYDLPEDAPRPFEPAWDSVNYLALDEDTDPTGLHNLYRNSVHFVDGLVGQTLDELEAQGLMDDTIVVVTGDHGQEFNDLGLNYWGHNGNFSRYQTQVPMIVHWPGRSEAGKQVEHVTSAFDVAPTLLEHALGVENAYDATSVGHDLFSDADRLPLIMAKYRGHAALADDGFVAFHPFGPVEALRRDYRPREGGPSPQVIQTTLNQMQRFREID
jgi:hypothetical protein